MVKTNTRITTLLLAFGILLIGHGLQLTLLPLYALSIGWSSTQIGLTGSSYFLGFIAGCVFVPGTVSQVGHIRAFMVLAAVATAALLTAALLIEFWVWLPLRFATGVSIAGLYMIIESWLTEVSPKEKHGTVLSVYLAVSLLGMALGQLPLIMSAAVDLRLFMLAAVLLCIAIIPIGLTRTSSPGPIPRIRVTPSTLMRASRVAVVCAVVAGMVNGGFWTLGPVVGGAFGLSPGQVGLLISLGVLGGAFSQFPVGQVSDRTDRRIVIGILAVLGAGVSALALMFAGSAPLVLYGIFMLLCATSMPVYALCVALAADDTELTMVQVTSGMLLANGIGSVIGPMIAAPLMSSIGPGAFFVYCAVCLGGAAIWTFHRLLVVERPRAHDVHARMLPRTTQAVAEFVLEEQATVETEDSTY